MEEDVVVAKHDRPNEEPAGPRFLFSSAEGEVSPTSARENAPAEADCRRERSPFYARPSVSWLANRLRQMPDARTLRRERGVFMNFAASSDSRASRSRSAWRSRWYRR